jgi:cytosine permease
LSRLESLVEDFSTIPVPQARTVSGVRVALIIVGISIALPAFVAGAQVGTALGLERATIAFCVGGLILSIVASMTALVGAGARLSTYMLVQFAFGTAGARIVNAVFAGTMIGWFGVNAALFGDAMMTAVNQMYREPGGWPFYVAVGSALMVLTTIFGFKALDCLSRLAVPLLLAILIAIMSVAISQSSPNELFRAQPQTMSLGLAISAVAGGSMVGAASIPDLTRYVSSRRGAVGSMFVSYGLAGPLILLSAAVPSLVTGEANLMKILLGLGFGLPALFVLVFSTWTSNAANVYSAGLSLAATFRNQQHWKLTLIAGGLGTIAALSGIMNLFIPFMIGLGVIMTPIAAIYVVDFFVVARRRYELAALDSAAPLHWPAFGAWGIGAAAGLVTASEFATLTMIPALDALLLAGSAYAVLVHWRTLLSRPVPECGGG